MRTATLHLRTDFNATAGKKQVSLADVIVLGGVVRMRLKPYKGPE